MCDCTSCKYTDSFSGWVFDPEQDKHVPDQSKGGFASWPRGEPKGAVTSAAEYRAHAKHCGSIGLPKPWRYVSRPPQFSTYGLTMPIPQAPKMVLDWINRSGSTPAPIAEPKRPALAIVPKLKPASIPDDVAEFVRRRMAA